NAERCGHDINDSNQGLLRDLMMTLGSGEGKDGRADQGETEGPEIGLDFVWLMAGQKSEASAERGDLRQRKVNENDFSPDDVQAQIDQNAGKQQARDERPFHDDEQVAAHAGTVPSGMPKAESRKPKETVSLQL